jgi:hypothetical protein
MPAGGEAGRWSRALQRALEAKGDGVLDRGYDVIAKNVVLLAEQGEKWAIEEIANRSDGKCAQSVLVGGQPGAAPIIVGVVRLVRPDSD